MVAKNLRRFFFPLRRAMLHEYWPFPWFFVPLIPWYLIKVIKYKSFTFFTVLNPALPYGGLFGEKKSEILALFPQEFVPPFFLIQKGNPINDEEKNFLLEKIGFPLIAKPEIGERGRGVTVISSFENLLSFLASVHEDYLLQKKVDDPIELGVFIAKNEDQKFTILSITGKKYLTVNGDGFSTIQQLLSQDLRGSIQVKTLEKELPNLLDGIPQKGEQKIIKTIGNHCLGTTFLDKNYLKTPELEEAINNIFSNSNDIDYGRLDLKVPSEEDAKAGKNIKILEFNGVTSEPGHVYDPSYSYPKALAETLRHGRVLASLAENKIASGQRPAPLSEVWEVLGTAFQQKNKWWFKAIAQLVQAKKDQKKTK